ncbi:MAG: PEGA domain-containing protein, partial [Polyangiales bacterium]
APAASASGAGSASGSAAPATSGSADAKAKDEAKQHFINGVGLMQEEQWGAALVEFNISIQLFPTRNARKNLAECLKQLGKFAEALEQYETLMRDFGSQLPPADLEQIQKSMNYVKGLVGFIQINSSVQGATVVVDGVPRGKTPLAPVRVSQGPHTINVSAEGYIPFVATRDVLGKQTIAVDVTLEVLARSGRIQIIEENGADAEVFIDGAPKGKVGKTAYEERVAPGTHFVYLKGPGIMGTQPVPANVQVDQTVVLRLRLEELPAEVRVETDPIGASIILDGVPVGQGSWEGRLRGGQHKIDSQAEGYFRTTKSFDAKTEGGKQTWKVALDRDENSPFWTKGRTRPISISLFGDVLIGAFGFGSDYERSCSNGLADCYTRSKPFGGGGGLRAGYEVAPGLSIELELGYMYAKANVARKTTLYGEQSTPVKVDVTDDWSLSGFVVGLGASYAFIRRPIVLSGAIAGGAIIGAKVKDRRSGTTPCLDNNGVPNGATDCSSAEVLKDPTTRPMLPTTGTASKTIPFFAPQLRIAMPITEAFQIGLGLGVLIGIGELRPEIKQTPQAVPTDKTAMATGTDGKPHSIGFVPQPAQNATPESAIGTFIIPRAELFFKLAF